jgi:hypothetical protein
MLCEGEESGRAQLYLILTKLRTFRSADHIDRKRALRIASKLLELSTLPQPCGQYAQAMQVRGITTWMA